MINIQFNDCMFLPAAAAAVAAKHDSGTHTPGKINGQSSKLNT
jgi:hypothetical protein